MPVKPSKGLSCPNAGVCATRDSCHHWQKKDRELNNTRKGSAAYKKLIKEYKSAICNRADKGLCCPEKGKNILEIDLKVRVGESWGTWEPFPTKS